MCPEKLYELSIVPDYAGDELTVVDCIFLIFHLFNFLQYYIYFSCKNCYSFSSVQFPLLRMDSASPKKQEVNYSFVYIAHPRAVTGFSWRKTSKHMPK